MYIFSCFGFQPLGLGGSHQCVRNALKPKDGVVAGLRGAKRSCTRNYKTLTEF